MYLRIRDITIDHLRELGNYEIEPEKSKYGVTYGICHQIDGFLLQECGYHYDFGGWACDSVSYSDFMNKYEHSDDFVDWNGFKPFDYKPRRQLCLDLATEIENNPSLFWEGVWI